LRGLRAGLLKMVDSSSGKSPRRSKALVNRDSEHAREVIQRDEK